MIVLSKKRIIFLVSVLMVSFIVILVNGNVLGNSLNDEANFTVILDARASVNQTGRGC